MSKLYTQQKKPHEAAGADSARQAAPAFSNQAMLDILKAPENVRATPLSQEMNEKMSQHFGVSLQGIKVFENENLNRIGETAFAHGNEIHVAKGQYAPGTAHGQEVLMHEAAHVVQQGMGLTHGSGEESAALEAQARSGSIMGNAAAFSMPTATAAAPVQAFGGGLLRKIKGLFRRNREEPQERPQNVTFGDLAAPAPTEKELRKRNQRFERDKALADNHEAKGNYFGGDYLDLDTAGKVRSLWNMAYSIHNDQHDQYVTDSEKNAYYHFTSQVDSDYIDEMFRQKVDAVNRLEAQRQKYMKKGKSEDEIKARIMLSKEGMHFSNFEDFFKDIAMNNGNSEEYLDNLKEKAAALRVSNPDQAASMERFTGYFSNYSSNIEQNDWVQNHASTVRRLNKKALRQHAKMASGNKISR